MNKKLLKSGGYISHLSKISLSLRFFPGEEQKIHVFNEKNPADFGIKNHQNFRPIHKIPLFLITQHSFLPQGEEQSLHFPPQGE
jgi:hypothetical protein